MDTFKIEKGMSQTAIINRFWGKLLEKGQGLGIFNKKHVIMQSRGLERKIIVLVNIRIFNKVSVNMSCINI